MALTIGMALAACARDVSSTGEASSRSHGQPTLVVADSDEPQTLNPLLIGGLSEDLQVLLFSCLLRSGPHGDLIPDVAVRIPTLRNGDISADGRSIRYRLRRGMTWSDGIALTARDIAYTFGQIMNARNNTSARIPYIDVASLSAPDDYTLDVRLKRVDAAFIPKFFAGSFCWGILPQHVLRGYASLNAIPFNAAPIGSGPFRVASWRRGDRLVLEPNSRFFHGAPHFRIVDRFIPDRTTIVTELRTGEVDAAFREDPAAAIAASADPRLRVYRTPFSATGTLIFNVADPLLQSPELRAALGSAIDAASVARSVSLGVYRSRDVGRAVFGWAYDPRIVWPRYDPAAAARRLDALQWRLGPDGYRHRAGRTLALTLISSSQGLDPEFCVSLQFQLRRAGIDVTLKTYESSTLYAPAADGGPLRSGAFALAYVPQYYIDFDGDLSSYLRCDRQPPRGYNFGHYCNPRVDRLNQAALETLDRGRRATDYHAVQRLLAADLPWLSLWTLTKVDIVSRRVHGFIGTPRYDPYYGVQTWNLDP